MFAPSYKYSTLAPLQTLMLFLQNLPTSNWTDDDMHLLLAEAYRLKYMFADAPGHLHAKK